MQSEPAIAALDLDEPSALASFCAGAEFAIGRVTEWVAGSLVLVETIVLFAGVFSRYVLRRAVRLVGRTRLHPVPVARHARRRHRLSPQRAYAHDRAGREAPSARARPFFEALALVVGLGFLACVALPGVRLRARRDHHHDAGAGNPDVWRAAALPVGLALMLVIGLLRHRAHARLADVAGGVALVAVVGAALWFGQPAIMALGNLQSGRLLRRLSSAAPCSPACRSPSPSASATFGYLALTTRTPLIVIVGAHGRGHEPSHPARRCRCSCSSAC